MVFQDRVLEDHPDYDQTGPSQQNNTAGKRKTMATRTRESQQEFVERMETARRRNEERNIRNDTFSGQYRQRKKAKKALLEEQVALEVAQREQEDHRVGDGLVSDHHPGAAEQEQSQACGLNRVVRPQNATQGLEDPESRPEQSQAWVESRWPPDDQQLEPI